MIVSYIQGVVAGTSLSFGLDSLYSLSAMTSLSPDSRYHSFDHRGGGYARGERVAVVSLNRQSDGIAAGLNTNAVIRATGTNQNGLIFANTSQHMQETLIRDM